VVLHLKYRGSVLRSDYSLLVACFILVGCGRIGGSSAGLLTDRLVCSASVSEVTKEAEDLDAKNIGIETTIPIATSDGIATTVRQLAPEQSEGNIWGAVLKLTALGAKAADVLVELKVQSHTGTPSAEEALASGTAVAKKTINGGQIAQGATWLLVDFGNIIPLQSGAYYYLNVTAVAGTNGSDKVLWYTTPGSDLEAYTIDASTLLATWRSLGRAGVAKAQICR